MRARPIVAGLFLCTALSRTASATPSFPGVVAARLALAAPPDCSLCHAGTPARGTVTTPFGTTMRSRGAAAYDEASIQTALDALEAERKDSDRDGVADIAELKAGTDPNAEAGGSDVVTPEYGCAIGAATVRTHAWLAIVAACSIVVGLRRRRTARHARHVRR